jgi:hypothetical protein
MLPRTIAMEPAASLAPMDSAGNSAGNSAGDSARDSARNSAVNGAGDRAGDGAKYAARDSAGNGAGRSSAGRFEIVAWLALWLVARGALLLAFADVFDYGEESAKACAGKAMLDGLGVPHYQLAFHYYEGGGFVVSHLDALAFALFGPSLLAVKLVALALGGLVLWAGWSFCRRCAGVASARAFALLFVLAPESVQKNSLLALGIHFHALLFVTLILSATLRLAFARHLRPRVWFTWGACLGFGFFFSYQCALTIALSIATLAIVLRSDVFTRVTWWGVAGVLCGLAPLVWMFAHVDWAVFDIHGAELVGGSETKLDTLKQFCASVFGQREPFDLAGLIAWIAAPSIAVVALARNVPGLARNATILVLAHLALFVAAYLGSGFTVGRVYHYFPLHRLMPLWFLAALAIALGVGAALASGRAWLRCLACACVLIPASAGAVDEVRLVRGAAPGEWSAHLCELARTKGYAYTEYLPKLSLHLDESRAEKLATLLRFKEPHPTTLHEAIALALYGDGMPPIEEVLAEVGAAGVSDPRGFLLGLGSLLTAQLAGDVVTRTHDVELMHSPYQDELIEAVGRYGSGILVTEDRVRREVKQGIVAGLPDAYFRGVGHRLYGARGIISTGTYFQMRNAPLMLDHRRADAMLDVCPEPYASTLRCAYDEACYEHSLPAR